MDYLAFIKAQEPEKMALITAEHSYSYGELAAKTQALRDANHSGKRVHFIHEEKIADQLLQFLAYSGTGTVPVIAPAASKLEDFSAADIPPQTVMGVFTSGSSGSGKLLWRSFASWADFFPEQNRIFGIDFSTVIFCQGSLAFTGNLSIYLGVFFAGGTIVATERFRPKAWLQQMQKYGVNCLYLIPAKLLLLTKAAAEPLTLVRSIICGSQSMGRSEAQRVRQNFPQAEITLYYGASELNYITYIKDQDMTEDRSLVGKPFRGVHVEIRGDEIFIDTPYRVQGIRLPYSLKDRGYLDAEGQLHFLGRTDDLCSINGRNISIVKVEEALADLAGVEEAAALVITIHDADILVAFLASQVRYSKPELLRLLRLKLADYELPKKFYFLPKLPKNESGKIAKQQLRQLACEKNG